MELDFYGFFFCQFRSRSYQTFFSPFFFFGVKLGDFTINNFFLYVTKMQAYQQKAEKFFVGEEKKFGRIDSRWMSISFFFDFRYQWQLYSFKRKSRKCIWNSRSKTSLLIWRSTKSLEAKHWGQFFCFISSNKNPFLTNWKPWSHSHYWFVHFWL